MPKIKEIDQKVVKMLQLWVNVLVPQDPKMRGDIAEKTGLNAQTLDKIRGRPSVSTDTLFRLMLAQNVSEKSIPKFPFSSVAFLEDSLIEWIRFGARLTDKERKTFIKVSKTVKSELC